MPYTPCLLAYVSTDLQFALFGMGLQIPDKINIGLQIQWNGEHTLRKQSQLHPNVTTFSSVSNSDYFRM